MSDHGKYGMPTKKKGHGVKGYWIYGEGYYEQDGGEQPKPEPSYGEKPQVPDGMMKFCRLFPDLEKFRPTREDLEPLGLAMADFDEPNPVDNPPDSPIPAGFTYFGQFVDHDISRTPDNQDPEITIPTIDPDTLPTVRTPALDLDALYGEGPGAATFYQPDGVHLTVGTADEESFGNAPELPNDLPRVESKDKVPMTANIGDNRNDENLAVAQTHLAMIKFHNKVVDDNGQPNDFEGARRVVRQHYQSVVWHDFVSRLVDPAIFAKIEKNGREWFIPDGLANRDDLCMPVEFSVAAYRIGHTMVRNAYEWNRVFNSAGPNATLLLLFQFSEGSGNLSPNPEGAGNPRLPANWVADWRLLHDLAAVDPTLMNPNFNMNLARPLNTRLAAGLGDLVEFRRLGVEDALRNLAVRNLIRGAQLGLATGQDVAAKIGVPVLTPAELTSGPHGQIIGDKGFDTRTPLWFYVLKEAEVQHGGQHLGDVGSTIVAETFHGLLDHSEDSIFHETNWAPSLPSASSDKFTMADLLIYVDDINPLGENLTS
ncbi:MAG: peroxidase family protein [Geminicoccaceae bacterium]